MPKITPRQVAPGKEMESSDVNDPINTIASLVNGKLDNVNLADGAVTSPKIADGAVMPKHLDSTNGFRVYTGIAGQQLARQNDGTSTNSGVAIPASIPNGNYLLTAMATMAQAQGTSSGWAYRCSGRISVNRDQESPTYTEVMLFSPKAGSSSGEIRFGASITVPVTISDTSRSFAIQLFTQGMAASGDPEINFQVANVRLSRVS